MSSRNRASTFSELSPFHQFAQPLPQLPVFIWALSHEYTLTLVLNLSRGSQVITLFLIHSPLSSVFREACAPRTPERVTRSAGRKRSHSGSSIDTRCNGGVKL